MVGEFSEEHDQGGIGVIVRGEEGEGRCVAAFARPVPHAISAIHVEAEAFRAGLLIAIQ